MPAHAVVSMAVLPAGAAWAKSPGYSFYEPAHPCNHPGSKTSVHPLCRYHIGLWKSTTGGAEWRKTSVDSINALVLDTKGIMYLAVDQRGLLKSEDGGETFQEINHGYINRTSRQCRPPGARPSVPLRQHNLRWPMGWFVPHRKAAW